MNLISDLNTQQQQAVMAGLGPVLVLAGPGSGKTHVLTQRIAYLIGSMGVRPYNILAVTFTNKAAREMENRVLELIGDFNRGLTLGTFHSTCARILRREAANLPIASNFVIFDQDDQIRLVKTTLKDLNLDEKRYRPFSVHSAISNAKNELLLPDSYPVSTYRDEVVKRVYQRYQQMLLANNAVDFDDLLLWTAYLLEDNLTVRDKYARRFEHILVDEFQDTNLAQYKLLRSLASFHKNIFVVGDADQSIYRWRGADYRNVLRFQEDYPDTQVILLEQNYRSKQKILDVATAIIDQNPHRTPKDLFTKRGEGEKVILYETENDQMEADYIVETIAGMVARGQAEPGDFAIMYRTNAQSRVLEEAFLTRGLPYRLIGAQRFYGRREIKDVVAFLRLIHNPRDEISLARIINVPPRKIGNKTFLSLRTASQNARLPMSEILQDLGKNPESEFSDLFTNRTAAVLANFGNLLSNWVAQREDLSPLELMDLILGDVGYRDYIDDRSEEGQSRWENIMELRRLASEYNQQGLGAFLEQVALVSDQDTLREGTNVPTLLTLHAAKGLEFPTVMIVGLNDGILPHSRSFEEPEEMMEERRLFYVGITRAKDRLYLIYSQTRSAYGYSEPVEPSRYLEDIPYELINEVRSSRPRRITRTSQVYSPRRWHAPEAETNREEPVHKQRYHPGMMVEHPSWGEGMVLNTRLQDSDEIVDIVFNGVGLKRVAASLANLQIKEK